MKVNCSSGLTVWRSASNISARFERIWDRAEERDRSDLGGHSSRCQRPSSVSRNRRLSGPSKDFLSDPYRTRSTSLVRNVFVMSLVVWVHFHIFCLLSRCCDCGCWSVAFVQFKARRLESISVFSFELYF